MGDLFKLWGKKNYFSLENKTKKGCCWGNLVIQNDPFVILKFKGGNNVFLFSDA